MWGECEANGCRSVDQCPIIRFPFSRFPRRWNPTSSFGMQALGSQMFAGPGHLVKIKLQLAPYRRSPGKLRNRCESSFCTALQNKPRRSENAFIG